jgi:isopentenyl-diphosphate Delta-isomerase
MNIAEFEGRKKDHIRQALNPAHQAEGLVGLAQIRLSHEALPNIDLADVDLKTNCLGVPVKTPFYIAGMTAGHADAPKINRTLAVVCAKRGWAMGVGSQRRDLEPGVNGSGDFEFWKSLRAEVPELVLFANLGVSQVLGAKAASIKRLVTGMKANALALHFNALQEAIQPEGTPHFKGAFQAIKKLCAELKDIPMVFKETGCGFTESTLKRLATLGPAAIDVSGLGGTHWGRIEGARAGSDSLQAQAAATFANWGEPTVDSVIAARRSVRKKTDIWASGGVRSGLDAAKLIALGSHRVGYAQPALQAALSGEASLDRWMQQQEFELRVALFCTGSSTPKALREKEDSWKLISG